VTPLLHATKVLNIPIDTSGFLRPEYSGYSSSGG
jgi:hypothetical protein